MKTILTIGRLEPKPKTNIEIPAFIIKWQEDKKRVERSASIKSNSLNNRI